MANLREAHGIKDEDIFLINPGYLPDRTRPFNFAAASVGLACLGFMGLFVVRFWAKHLR